MHFNRKLRKREALPLSFVIKQRILERKSLILVCKKKWMGHSSREFNIVSRLQNMHNASVVFQNCILISLKPTAVHVNVKLQRSSVTATLFFLTGMSLLGL